MSIPAAATVIFTLIYGKTLPRCTSDPTCRTMGPILQNCLGETSFFALQDKAEFRELRFRAHQIFYLVNWARTERRTEISIGSLMRAFNCSRSAVHSALANGLSPPKSRGRHLTVDAESDANILAWIKKQAEKNAAVTRTDIKNYCHEVCRLEVSRGWVDSFILRHSAELTEKKSSPQEEPRLQVPRIFLEETIRYAVCTKHSKAVQPTWYLILMKLEYPIGKIENRRRLSCRSPWPLTIFTIEYLGT